MKPVSYFLSLMTVFGLAASVLSGCVDDIKEPGGSLVVSPTEFNNVKGTGETLTINVESDLYWSVYAQDSDGKTVSWIEFDKTAGMGSDQILATVKPSASERSCEIIIQADGSDVRAVVKVSQGKGTGEVAEGYEMPVYDIFDKEKQIVYQFSVVLFHQNEYLSSSFGTLDDSIIKVSIWIDYHVSDHK